MRYACRTDPSLLLPPSDFISQLDIEGLSITITAAPESNEKLAKGKAKAKSQGLEILANAKLRLKEGGRYALVGRNGTGKSSKLIHRVLHGVLV